VINRFRGKCACGVEVLPGEGTVRKGTERAWDTFCAKCSGTAPAVIPEQRKTITPTQEQQAALDLFAEGVNLAIVAGAGTGKSSTLEAIARSSSRRMQYLAFNSAIVRDAALRMPSNAACATSHSLAYRATGKRYAHRLESPRMRSSDIAAALRIEPFFYRAEDGKQKVLQPAKLSGMVMMALSRFANSADPVPTGRHLPHMTGLDVPGPNGERTYAVHDALAAALGPAIARAWNDIQSVDGSLRFTHDFYRKIWQLSEPIIAADVVLLDEAQDCAPVLADVIFRQESQVIVVGDPQQEIYGWAGAIDAMAGFPAERRTPLTWSFRFGEAIAEIANLILDQIPGSEIRLVGKGGPSKLATLSAPKAILTRTNGGSVMAVLEAMMAGRTPHLVGGGGDVLSFAQAAQALKAGKPVTHPELMCFDSWGEVQAYVEQDELGVELAMMVKLIDDYGVEQVIAAVSNPVSEAKADVVVSTAHKAKGRQWESVQLWSDFPPANESAADWRLLYVAATRAQKVLDPSHCDALRELMDS